MRLQLAEAMAGGWKGRRRGSGGRASERLASESLASETLASETLVSENLASETLASETFASETLASENVASETRASEDLANLLGEDRSWGAKDWRGRRFTYGPLMVLGSVGKVLPRRSRESGHLVDK